MTSIQKFYVLQDILLDGVVLGGGGGELSTAEKIPGVWLTHNKAECEK